MLNTCVDGLLRGRRVLAVLALGLLALAALQVPSLQFELSILPLLEGDGEALEEVDRYYQELPPRRFDLACILSWEEAVGAREMAEVAAFEEALRAEEVVELCFSLPEVRLLEHDGLLPRLVPLAERVGEGRVVDTLEGHPLLSGRVLSGDGRSVAVLVRATTGLEGDLDPRFFPELKAAAQRARPAGCTLRFIGRGRVEQAMKGAMRGDILWVLLSQGVLLVFLLPFLFRSVRGVLIPLCVVGSATLLFLALMAGLRLPFSIVDIAIPGLVTIIGMCDAVHMMHRFEEAYSERQDRRWAILSMLRGVGPACVATSVTTGLGFLSLTVARHPAVRDFGMKAALGVGATLVVLLLLVPLGLALWPLRGTCAPWKGLRRVGFGRPRWTLVVSLGVVLLSFVGVARCQVNSYWLEELPADHAVAQDLLWYEQHFGGLLRLDLRVEGDLRDPQVVAALDQLQRRMLREEGVKGAESYLDWLREASGLRGELSPAAVQRGWFLLGLSGEQFPRHIVNPEATLGRMVFRTSDVGSNRYFELVQVARGIVAPLLDSLPGKLRVEVSGHANIAHESNRLVVTTMLRSFLISLLTITLFIALIFRSWRLGLISLLPNLLPILVGLGLTGWLDINLRIGIAMIYCLGLGLAVDDSIHLIARYRQELRKGGDPRAAVDRALGGTGVALLGTSVVLVLGALCYLPSEFRSMRDVGILLSAMVGAALACDLWILPHLLLRWGPRSVSPVAFERD